MAPKGRNAALDPRREASGPLKGLLASLLGLVPDRKDGSLAFCVLCAFLCALCDQLFSPIAKHPIHQAVSNSRASASALAPRWANRMSRSLNS